MPYTREEGGRLNNFAAEPKMYIAEPPTNTEKRNYLIMGIGAFALVSGAMAIVFSIS
ncbi:MAG: ssl1498 family light-harvesting-like protein [Cyanobacteria bacterium SBLK]|nr:ssl1498 family light-harvesting-like protein [Cyanobacteria bacterium SBLK]